MKIKWNWGTKLIIAMAFFIGLLVILVVLSTRQTIMLVEKDYYPKGLKYQDRIDESNNALPYSDKIHVTQESDKVIVNFPAIKPDSGSIVFYRPSNNQLDLSFSLKADTLSSVSIPAEAFEKGKYIVKIFWEKQEKGYYIERPFYFK